jgi:hypothetical protein
MSKRIIGNLSVFIFSVILSFGLAEIGVRLIGSFDETGQFYFQDHPIPPYPIPTEYTNELIAEYKIHRDEARIIYDSQLGWNLQANYSDIENGVFINSAGIRAIQEYDLVPADDIVRIALFGDSYTYDGDVANHETWAKALENELLANNIKAEVINFGVSGYGMDQAYLLWKVFGRNYQPDIVIFGFVLKDAQRNVNVFRQILNPTTGIPFSKPRFVHENGNLRLVNSPTIPLDEIVHVLANFHNSELSQYEYYYDNLFVQKWWLNSKFLAVISDFLSPTVTESNGKNVNMPTDSDEHIVMARSITQQFSNDVSDADSQFIVAFLPDKLTVGHLNIDTDKYPYLETYKILPELAQQYVFINAEDAFVDDGGVEFPRNQSHFDQSMSAKVGAFLAHQIIDCIDSKACQLSRFDEHSFDER